MNKKKAVCTAAAAAAIAGTLTIGGMMAYFTDADDAVNTFTVGKISVDLTEPDWDPEDATEITPNETISKDPTVTNDGVNDEFVFLKVTVPYKNIVTANADGTKNEKADTQLFSYEVKSGWTLLDTEKNEEDGVTDYVYAYTGSDAGSMLALAAGESAPALFDSVTFVNAVEGQDLEESTQNIDISAYAIQSSFLGENADETAPSEVWEILSNQSADQEAE